MMDKKRIIDEIAANDFSKQNGAVMRTIGTVFNTKWFKTTDLLIVFKDMDETDIYQSLDYLQQGGFISVRNASSKDSVEVYDFDLDETEVRLTNDGLKLLMFRKKDELIEI